jgi:hypothetical protein
MATMPVWILASVTSCWVMWAHSHPIRGGAGRNLYPCVLAEMYNCTRPSVWSALVAKHSGILPESILMPDERLPKVCLKPVALGAAGGPELPGGGAGGN